MNHIEFDEEKHQYKKNGVLYTSVTTVIKKYCNPFDAQYWATYKAIKDVITNQMGDSSWNKYKKLAGGWKEVVPYFKENGHHLHQTINNRKVWYIKLWEDNSKEACRVGTREHKKREKHLLGSKSVPTSSSGEVVNIQVGQKELLLLQEFTQDRLYPELVISNDEFRVAGTADRVEKFGLKVHIKDYKTSKEIKQEAFDDQKMLYPLNELLDCNYNHYMLQFSFYGWMLEQNGFEVSSLELQHLLPPDYKDEDMVPYKMQYRPDLIVKMLKHFRNK